MENCNILVAKIVDPPGPVELQNACQNILHAQCRAGKKAYETKKASDEKNEAKKSEDSAKSTTKSVKV